MKKILLSLLLCSIISTISAQIYMGESEALLLPRSTEYNLYGGYAPSIFIRYYASDSTDYATCVISIPSYNKNVDIRNGNTIILEHDNSNDTTYVLNVNKQHVNVLELTVVEFNFEYSDLFQETPSTIRIQQDNRPDYRIDIKHWYKDKLAKMLRNKLAQAKENARKAQSGIQGVHTNTPDHLAEKHVPTATNKRKTRIIEDVGIGITAGGIKIKEEGMTSHAGAYGAHLTLLGLYTDFRIIPAEKVEMPAEQLKTSCYQFNVGYRVQVYKGLGITPLIGMIQCKVDTRVHDVVTVEYNKKYFNFGGMIDYIFLNQPQTTGIKIGAVAQKYNFGISVGVVYNL